MLGFAEKEGIWRANYFLPDDEKSELWHEFLDKFDELATLGLGLTNQTKDPQAVLDSLVDHYGLGDLDDGPLTEGEGPRPDRRPLRLHVHLWHRRDGQAARQERR